MRKRGWTGLGALALAVAFLAIAHDRQGGFAAATARLVALPVSAAAAEPVRTAPSRAADATASPDLPALPTVEVPTRPVHTVPGEAPPAAGSRFSSRARRDNPGRGASLTPMPSGLRPNPIFSGAARAAGGTTLAVAGREVRLFGVRVAGPRDRCGSAAAGDRDCADAARDALARRLRRSPRVSCQMPPGQIGKPGAICIDSSGTDLGGFLVAEGLALADTDQSYEYFGAEGAARSFGRGLWRYR